MKFLIQNYSHYQSTQPFYFYRTLQSIEGCECHMFDNRVSIYDAYDSCSPDYVIINGSAKFDDIISYQKNTDKNISHLINIDYLDNDNLNKLSEYVKQTELNCEFFFGSKKPETKMSKRYVQINNAADNTALESHQVNADYHINKAIVIHEPYEVTSEESCHTINYDGKVKADLNYPCGCLQKAYKCYDKIVFNNMKSDFVNQSVLEALLFGNAVYISNSDKSEESKITNMLNKMLGVEFDFANQSNDNVAIFKDIKEKIESKHLPINRVKTLLSNLQGTHEILQQIK